MCYVLSGRPRHEEESRGEDEKKRVGETDTVILMVMVVGSTVNSIKSMLNRLAHSKQATADFHRMMSVP